MSPRWQRLQHGRSLRRVHHRGRAVVAGPLLEQAIGMTAKGKSLGYHETTGRRWRSSRTLANTHSSVGGGDLKGSPTPRGFIVGPELWLPAA